MSPILMPNLIERMENLIVALDEARFATEEGKTMEAGMRIDDAHGIAGEVLTMIDGR